MKKNCVALLVALLAGILPAVGLAMDKNGMAGMEMGGDMIMLEPDTQDGVKAMVHLIDIRESMAQMGMSASHHFMVMFTDAATGAQLDKGIVALKITDPKGNQTKPLKLMAMDGAFGSDISLPEKGGYRFEVGTKLHDGSNRQFQFEYTVQ